MTDRAGLLAIRAGLEALLERVDAAIAGEVAPSPCEVEIADIEAECAALDIPINDRGCITSVGYARLTGRKPKTLRNRRSNRKDEIPSRWDGRDRQYAIEDIANYRLKQRHTSR